MSDPQDPTRTRRKLVARDFERMNLPEGYWRSNVSRVANAARTHVTRYLLEVDSRITQSAGLVITGEAGVGKTGIASLILKEARARGYTGYFSTLWELRECIRNKILYDNEISILDRCREVDVLALDGFALDDIKEHFVGLRFLTELILYRGARRRVTLLTTQIPVEDLKEIDGFMANLQGCMVIFPVEGPDLRENEQQQLRDAIFSDD